MTRAVLAAVALIVAAVLYRGVTHIIATACVPLHAVAQRR